MAKAFTHMCQEVNISLFNNTLTVYRKKSADKDSIFQMAAVFFGMDCTAVKMENVFLYKKDELGIYRMVHREDADHDLYHQDNFLIEDPHYHAQFARTIDKQKLTEILRELEKNSIITPEEHLGLITAYENANSLPTASAAPLQEQKTAKPIDSSLKPGDKIILQGLKGTKSTHLNGRTGIIDSIDASTGQFIVNLTPKVNDLVTIHNLNSESGKELNGKTGKIANINKDRFIVNLFDLGRVTQKAIKPENLQNQYSLKTSNLKLVAEQNPEYEASFSPN